MSKEQDAAVGNLMRDEHGRASIWSQLQGSCVFSSTFAADPIKHAFNAGVRAAGLQLADSIKLAAPDDYFKMIKENM